MKKKYFLIFTFCIPVEEETCRQYKHLCLETGGSCVVEDREIQCICPNNVSYSEDLGCQGK